jgi:hypothetical protein
VLLKDRFLSRRPHLEPVEGLVSRIQVFDQHQLLANLSLSTFAKQLPDTMAGIQQSETHEKGPTSEHNEPLPADVLAVEASQAAAAEHRMSLWQAIKTYPKAIGWSVLLSSTLIMGKRHKADL